MHPVSFAFKRGHIRAVVAHRDMLKPFDITPARFDALFVIRARGGSCYQSEIWDDLGLHPSTISRMIKSMVERGLVASTPVSYGDGRERIISLTRTGFKVIVAAVKAFIHDDELRQLYERMHDGAVEAVKSLVAAARNVGEWLGDIASHFYPFEAPSLEEEERRDAEVKEAIERDEDLRGTKDEGLRGLESLAPDEDPMHPDYFYCETNVSLKKRDPTAWDEKLTLDWERYFELYAKAFHGG
ncbi:MAG: MarR family transcriptional regulator [Deltaproteobacteria bacterium]|nr:MarR family transcriptional regulator [Deltaproteobacteria bacterium]